MAEGRKAGIRVLRRGASQSANRWVAGIATAVVLGLLVVVAPIVQTENRWIGPPVLLGALPALAAQLLPEAERLLADCPEMPTAWLYAIVTVESSWNPMAFSSAGAAGLVQMMPSSWTEAGGGGSSWTRALRPVTTHPVWEPLIHLDVAVPWMCDRLTTITTHVLETDKPIHPLDAAAVCHVAGCSRVFASPTGLPRAGDAGCDHACVRTVESYIARVRAIMARITGDDGSLLLFGAEAAGVPEPAPGPTDCVIPDPTGTGGCVTARTAHLVSQIDALWQWPWPVFCWGTRPSPVSDHPFGRACDLTVGAIGRFPTTDEREAGWAMAMWLTAHADSLAVQYVIWDGHLWHRNTRAWGRYGGGGIYDPNSVTGGHFDHVHVSVQR